MPEVRIYMYEVACGTGSRLPCRSYRVMRAIDGRGIMSGRTALSLFATVRLSSGV